MFKILVPVDFSDASGDASFYALQMAAAIENAQLSLLHCFQDYLADADPDILLPEQMNTTEDITERIIHRNETEAQEQLENLYKQLQQELLLIGKKVFIERTFIHGFPEDKIKEEVKRFKPNLVVMGTRGRSNLSRSFFGTVTTKAVENLKAPVLTIPEDYNSNQILRVAYATEFNESDSESIHQLQQILYPFNPLIYCVHICSGDITAKEEHALNNLKIKLQHAAIDQNLKYILLKGKNISATLKEFVEREVIDILALTTLKRGFLDKLIHPSLAEELVLDSPVPLLIFHSSAHG